MEGGREGQGRRAAAAAATVEVQVTTSRQPRLVQRVRLIAIDGPAVLVRLASMGGRTMGVRLRSVSRMAVQTEVSKRRVCAWAGLGWTGLYWIGLD